MSGINVFSGARNVVVSGAITVAETINYNVQLSNRITSGAAIPLMPNASTRFTGRTEILAKMNDHFSKGFDNEQHRRRKYFLLHGMGGIGKTQICLRFIEDMSGK
ncbi:hypothetical protein K443DRAFT_112816 [Laccaria amethystina LaAM-08-1]|uniref:NB-ARC domain-containing protein n=1 Tax=Laccaria amethystina LaAM-08-1 TaxID=1095629 RepID=A0A0C9X5M6_9AGAR|nr:hypothetical protein K443DRAFT_112816 [Laccaria amethystina LaAM-08-1]